MKGFEPLVARVMTSTVPSSKQVELSRLVFAANTQGAQLRLKLPDPGRGVKELDLAQIGDYFPACQ